MLADEDGVVVVPLAEVGRVVERAKEGRRVDALCAEGIRGGMSVGEAFKKFRG